MSWFTSVFCLSSYWRTFCLKARNYFFRSVMSWLDCNLLTSSLPMLDCLWPIPNVFNFWIYCLSLDMPLSESLSFYFFGERNLPFSTESSYLVRLRVLLSIELDKMRDRSSLNVLSADYDLNLLLGPNWWGRSLGLPVSSLSFLF